MTYCREHKVDDHYCSCGERKVSARIDERTQIYSPTDVDNLIVMAIEKCARKCSEYEDYHWKLYQANPNSQQAWDHQTRANAAANCESAILALRSEFLPPGSLSIRACNGFDENGQMKWRDIPAVKLVYNKATKRIDKVRTGDGLVLESFEPPIEEE